MGEGNSYPSSNPVLSPIVKDNQRIIAFVPKSSLESPHGEEVILHAAKMEMDWCLLLLWRFSLQMLLVLPKYDPRSLPLIYFP